MNTQDQIVRVAVVEDHTLLNQALVMMLKQEPRVVVAFHAENGAEFLSKLTQEKIDVVLLDLNMPIMDGKETLQILRENFPDIKVIILSMHDDPWIVSEMMREGAHSFLKKNCSFDEMMDAIFNVKFRGQHTSVAMKTADFSKGKNVMSKDEMILPIRLSKRSHLILKLICDGHTSEQIGQKMNLSKKTIDAERIELLKILGAKNPIELVRKSILHGLYEVRTDARIEVEEGIEEMKKQARKKSRGSDEESSGEEI